MAPLRLAIALSLALIAALPTAAQTRLRWGHVQEASEPHHLEALRAAKEIAERTQGRVQVEVFPASQLGSEPQLNQGLALGTIDIVYTAVGFAAGQYKPIAISGAPYMLRDFGHFLAYRDSELFRELAAGYDRASGHHMVTLTYTGERHVTANRAIQRPEDMRGLKLRVPQAPLYMMFARAVGANATPIAFAEVYMALQTGAVDAQENPLPNIAAKKLQEVQSHVILTGHITEAISTVVGGTAWRRIADADRPVVEQALREAAMRSTLAVREIEAALPAQFEREGKVIIRPDRAPFRAATLPLLTDPAAGAGWTKEQFDRLQAIGSATN